MTARGGAPATPLPGRGPALSTIYLGSRHNALPRCARTDRVHARGPVCAPLPGPAPLVCPVFYISAHCAVKGTGRHSAPPVARGRPSGFVPSELASADDCARDASQRRDQRWATPRRRWAWIAAWCERHVDRRLAGSRGARPSVSSTMWWTLSAIAPHSLPSSSRNWQSGCSVSWARRLIFQRLAAVEGVEGRAVGLAGRGGSPG